MTENTEPTTEETPEDDGPENMALDIRNFPPDSVDLALMPLVFGGNRLAFYFEADADYETSTLKLRLIMSGLTENENLRAGLVEAHGMLGELLEMTDEENFQNAFVEHPDQGTAPGAWTPDDDVEDEDDDLDGDITDEELDEMGDLRDQQ